MVRSELTFPIRIQSDRFDKFPTIWMVLCSRISDWIPIRIRAVPTDSARKMWGTDKTSRQLMLKHMFCFMIFLFHYLFSVSCALYVSFCFQILNNELVVHILEKRIMLHFVIFIPVCCLALMRLACFLLIYIINILNDTIIFFL